MDQLHVALLFPKLPPAADGIGDYTAQLARALVPFCQVSILTAGSDPEPVPEAAVQVTFSLDHPAHIRELRQRMPDPAPDWLVLQYNPFSYGRYGFNPWLPQVFSALKRDHPTMRLGLMIHEPFVPMVSPKFAVMTVWQRWQLWKLGNTADVVFCSIEAWTERFRAWFRAPVYHLPVGSNIPAVGCHRDAARKALGLGRDEYVIGLFGAGFTAGMQSFLLAVLEQLSLRMEGLRLLYVGSKGNELEPVRAGVDVLDAGRQTPTGVSRCFAAMDVALAPYPDGVSTRRGAFMAGLHHGVATVATGGELTDKLLYDEDGSAFYLASAGDPQTFAAHVEKLHADSAERARIGSAGRIFYEAHFAWPAVAMRLVEHLTEAPRGR